MGHRSRWGRIAGAGAALLVLPCAAAPAGAQAFSATAPDGSPAVVIAQGCVSSSYFHFSYRLPEGMQAQPISSAPAPGNSTGAITLFIAFRERGPHRDVAMATAENVAAEKNETAEKWMRNLRGLIQKRQGVVSLGEVQPLTVNGQKFLSLSFQQVRGDGSVVSEATYATALRGHIVTFIFGSADPAELSTMENSIQSFSTAVKACPAGK